MTWIQFLDKHADGIGALTALTVLAILAFSFSWIVARATPDE